MSIDTNAIIIVGIPYKDDDCLDDLIDSGELDIGSVHFDSARDKNIIGKIIFRCHTYKEIDFSELVSEQLKAADYLVERGFLRENIKTYLSLDII